MGEEEGEREEDPPRWSPRLADAGGEEGGDEEEGFRLKRASLASSLSANGDLGDEDDDDKGELGEESVAWGEDEEEGRCGERTDEQAGEEAKEPEPPSSSKEPWERVEGFGSMECVKTYSGKVYIFRLVQVSKPGVVVRRDRWRRTPVGQHKLSNVRGGREMRVLTCCVWLASQKKRSCSMAPLGQKACM